MIASHLSSRRGLTKTRADAPSRSIRKGHQGTSNKNCSAPDWHAGTGTPQDDLGAFFPHCKVTHISSCRRAPAWMAGFNWERFGAWRNHPMLTNNLRFAGACLAGASSMVPCIVRTHIIDSIRISAVHLCVNKEVVLGSLGLVCPSRWHP